MHPIESVLNYKFKNNLLLYQSLTHPSASSSNNYQRLEFLGDRVLGLMIANWLVMSCNNNEGVMAQYLSELTSKNHLARLADSWNILPHIRYSFANQKASINNLMADVVEALIAAVFLDSNFDTATEVFIFKLTDDSLWEKGERHAKNKLQEWTQKHQNTLPVYTVLSEDKSGFTVSCSVLGYKDTQATALQKRTAELKAAEEMLQQLGN